MPRQVSIEMELLSRDAAIVTLRGEHDIQSKDEVARALIAASVCQSVLVDVTDMRFVDSSVINALLRASKQLRERGGVFELVLPPGEHSIRRALDVLGLHGLLPSHATREAAVAAVEIRQASSSTAHGVRVRALVELPEPRTGSTRRRAA